MSVFSRLVTGDRFLFAALVFVIAWLPWPLGSNRPWAWAVAEFAAFAGLGVTLLVSRSSRHAFYRVLRDNRAVVILFAAWLSYQWLQTVDLGTFWLALLSPATADIYSSTTGLTGARAHSIAFDRGSVVDDLLKNTFYVVLFLTVCMLAHSRERLLALGVVVLGVGLLEACYGLVSYFATDARVMSGSFINRNHYGAFLAVAFALGLGLLYPESSANAAAPRGLGHRLRRAFELMVGWQALLIVTLVVLAAGLLLSQSRGAVGAVLGSVVLMTAFGAALREDTHAARRILAAALLIAAAGAAWFGTGSFGARLEALGEEGRERLLLWAFTLDLTRDFPWFGVGADNYAWIITSYRDFLDRAVTVTHAHNDYLELMAEQGLLGAVLAGTPVLLVLAGTLDGYRQRHDRLLLGILFGTLTASLAFLLHAAVEFNFQIPANAGYFYILLGMGLAAARVNRRPPVSGRDDSATSVTSAERRSRTESRRQ